MYQKELSKQQQKFLERLKRYKARGVRIMIDGRELPEDEWDRIFRFADREADGSSQFYMSDYVTGRNGEISEIRLERLRLKHL